MRCVCIVASHHTVSPSVQRRVRHTAEAAGSYPPTHNYVDCGCVHGRAIASLMPNEYEQGCTSESICEHGKG